MDSKDTTNSPGPPVAPDASLRVSIATLITLGFMATFIASLVALFIVAMSTPEPPSASGGVARKEWFDLLKSGLVLLGSSLTTIIGYYFGRQEATGAVAQVKLKDQELATKDQQATRKEQEIKAASTIIDQLIAEVKELSDSSRVMGSEPDRFDPSRAQYSHTRKRP